VTRNDDHELRPEDVPGPDADLGEIWAFAATFDGYRHCGGFHECAEIANAGQPETLAELRTCLFFEARRWRHFGESPDGEALAYIQDLVARIREAVTP